MVSIKYLLFFSNLQTKLKNIHVHVRTICSYHTYWPIRAKFEMLFENHLKHADQSSPSFQMQLIINVPVAYCWWFLTLISSQTKFSTYQGWHLPILVGDTIDLKQKLKATKMVWKCNFLRYNDEYILIQTLKTELSWCQLCHHWWHSTLS